MEKLFVLMIAAACAVTTGTATAQAPVFAKAKPVWLDGRETEMNVNAGFRAIVERPKEGHVALRLAASTIYRAFVNGEYVGHGPARGPHGYYRVDEWDITPKLHDGQNVVAIEVASYNANSYYLLDQPGFLQAEIVNGNQTLAATGDGDTFAAWAPGQRIQKVDRYSFQRPFSESYRLNADFDAWRKDPKAALPVEKCAVVGEKKLLARGVSYPTFEKKPALQHVASGTLESQPKDFKPKKSQGITCVNDKCKGYPEAELEYVSYLEVQKVKEKSREAMGEPISSDAAFSMPEMSFNIIDFGTNFTGFLGATVKCSKPTTLFFTFDEILTDGDVSYSRLGCANVIGYQLQEGDYELESFEPYTMRYANVLVSSGACEVSNIHVREYVNPDTTEARFVAADERLNKLFAAGVQTFAQNAVDVFMDCPSRERAGWLCDSFFTSRVAKDLGGSTRVERNFLENFLLPEKFAYLPDGMLPMCYPSDHYNGVFIPNWAMWFVMELEEYAQRSGDREMVDRLKPKVMALIDYFKPFLNSDGLLAKLQSWVFVEWSKANDFVQDVNYPSNMLYAAVLSAAGRMYDMPDLEKQAQAMRDTILKQSFDGEFFVDNALRKDGKLEVTQNHSEVCQYFAFFFGLATPESHPDLWKKLRDEFGPKRKESKLYPEVHEANSFVGNVLRGEILSQNGLGRQLLGESVDYLLYMADQTGTLWENVGAYASCDHGFASHICHTLYRDILGLYKVDTVKKAVHVRLCDVGMPNCEGTMPTPDGPVSLKWRVDGDKLAYHLVVPEGYAVTTENLSGKTPVEE